MNWILMTNARKMWCWIAAILTAYLTSYFALSRSSQSLMKPYGGNFFFYVPCSINNITTNQTLQSIHIAASYLYYPIAFVDHAMGGPICSGIPLDSLTNAVAK